MISINTKIALGTLSVFTALTLVGAATYAYFTDSGTSSNNIFTTGNLNLVLANGAGTDEENVTATFGGTNLAPGVCLDPATLNIKNASGSVAANHINVSAANTNSGLAAYLWLKTLTYDGVDVVIADGNSNGIRDLQDLATSGMSNYALTDVGVAHPLVMEVCLHTSATLDQAGQSNTLDLTVLLDQGPSSP